MRWVRWAGIGYLLCFVVFILGVIVGHKEVWPYHHLYDVLRFVRGDPDEKSTLAQKVANDLQLRPERHLRKYETGLFVKFDEVTGIPFKSRRDANPQVFVSDKLPSGYVAVFGKFDFSTGLNGVLVFSVPDGKLIWHAVTPSKYEEDVHQSAFHMRRDGSYFTTGPGGILHVGRCSEDLEPIPGGFHHSFSQIDEHRFWVSGSLRELDAFSIVNFETKSIEREILMEDVHEAADPELGIFLLNIFGSAKVREEDPWHLNDVDVLLPENAANSPFNAGDLVASYRHNNLIYVFDPNTLKIKWWDQTYQSGQHDPDFEPDGTITVYDNRAQKEGGYSNIISHDPQTPGPAKILLDGRKYDFNGPVNGKQTKFADGSILTFSRDQGRVLWVDKEGERSFELVNKYSESEVMILTNVTYMPGDYFDAGVLEPCK